MEEHMDEMAEGAADGRNEPLMPLSMPPVHSHEQLIKDLVTENVDPGGGQGAGSSSEGGGTDATEPLMPLSMPYVPPTDAGAGWGGTPPPFDPSAWAASAGGPGDHHHLRGRRLAALVALIALVAGGIGAAVAAVTIGTRSTGSNAIATLPPTPSPTPASSSKSNSNIVTSVAAEVTPAVVDIVTTIATQTGQTTQQAAGTGMIVTPSGEVLTNNHVVADATKIQVSIQGHSGLYNARVLGVDPPQSSDVALLQIEGVSNLPYVHLGDSSTVKVGDPVVAIGNALGMGGSPSVVNGIVSALNRTINASDSTGAATETLHGLIQTDAPIVPGDSGGPLVNAQGQVIGMDTAAYSPQGSGSGATLGFALPINTVKSIVSDIENGVAKNGIVLGESPYLGIFEQVSPGIGGFNFGNTGSTGNTGTTPATVSGVVLGGVAKGSPADQVGLVAGDVITAINGQKTTTWSALVSIVQKLHPGETLSLNFTDSSGVPHTVSLKLAGIPR